MPSEAKVAAVEELKQVLEGASSIYLTDFTGMPVSMMSELRRKCREADVEYRVVKDSLTKIAAEGAGVPEVVQYIEGPVALALGRGDQLAPARVLAEFAKEHKLPKMKAALVEGRIFLEAEVKTLATLPTRDVLLSQFVGGLMSPLQGVVGTINQVMWKLAATLEAVGKKIEETGGSAVVDAPPEDGTDEAPAEAEAAEEKADGPPGEAEGGAGEPGSDEAESKDDGGEAGEASDKQGE
jgi:large subunit ribosomal protein L10